MLHTVASQGGHGSLQEAAVHSSSWEWQSDCSDCSLCPDPWAQVTWVQMSSWQCKQELNLCYPKPATRVCDEHSVTQPGPSDPQPPESLPPPCSLPAAPSPAGRQLWAAGCPHSAG